MKQLVSIITVLLATAGSLLAAGDHEGGHGHEIPATSEGMQLFVDLACVACHSVNGIGGQDHAPLDAEVWDDGASGYEIAARMWASAPAMINAQEEMLGGQIFLTGAELEALAAFLLDAELQAEFTEAMLSDEMREMISQHGRDGHDHSH